MDNLSKFKAVMKTMWLVKLAAAIVATAIVLIVLVG